MVSRVNGSGGEDVEGDPAAPLAFVLVIGVGLADGVLDRVGLDPDEDAVSLGVGAVVCNEGPGDEVDVHVVFLGLGVWHSLKPPPGGGGDSDQCQHSSTTARHVYAVLSNVPAQALRLPVPPEQETGCQSVSPDARLKASSRLGPRCLGSPTPPLVVAAVAARPGVGACWVVASRPAHLAPRVGGM